MGLLRDWLRPPLVRKLSQPLPVKLLHRLAAISSRSRVAHVIGQTLGPACEMEITVRVQDKDKPVVTS